MTVKQLLAVMPAPEEDDWRSLEMTDPWGQAREDIRVAHQTAQLAALMGVKKVTGGPFTVKDLVLEFKIEIPKTEEETEAEHEARVNRMSNWLVAWAKAHNARWYQQHPEQAPPEDEPQEDTAAGEGT